MTQAYCGPSRASLYTGMYLMNHRSVLNGTPLDARHTNVALLARGRGYEPALFGYTDTSVVLVTAPPQPTEVASLIRTGTGFGRKLAVFVYPIDPAGMPSRDEVVTSAIRQGFRDLLDLARASH